MRTTLKRGLGRSAPTDGEGRPVLPPGAASPVSVYRQEPRRRSRLGLLGPVLVWVGLAALVFGVGTAGGVYLHYHEVVADLAPGPEVKRAQKQLAAPRPGEPAVALVIGYDHRPEDGKGAPSRSDTMMLMRADTETDSISLLSFPRDMLVEIRCPGRTPFVDRIAHAYVNCGPQGSLQTVKALTGLNVNYLITVNFRGFRQIVDRLDGVWLDVDHRYFNDVRGGTEGYESIDLQPGYRQLSGRQALDYVRFRHTDSDLYRVARQQQFVRAFKGQLQTDFKLDGRAQGRRPDQGQRRGRARAGAAAWTAARSSRTRGSHSSSRGAASSRTRSRGSRASPSSRPTPRTSPGQCRRSRTRTWSRRRRRPRSSWARS